jgi:hypothetical protein
MPFHLNTPQALYLLILIPLLIALYFIKTAYRQTSLPAIYLWHETIQRAKKRSFLHSILQNLLPFMYVMTAFFLILAIAEPIFFGAGTRHVGIVIDTSASMKTQAGKEIRRYDLAIQRAMEDLTKLEGRQIMIAEASQAATKIFPITSSSKTAIAYLKTLIPNDSGDSIEQAITKILAQTEQPPEIYIYTDHIPDKGQSGEGIHWIVFNQGEKNIGITNFSLRRNPAKPTEVMIMARIRNFGNHSIPSTFKILKESRVIHSRKIENSKSQSIVLTHSEEGSLFLKAVLQTNDDYAVDNTLWGYAPSNKPQRILLVDVTDSALLKVFNILPNVELNKVSYQQYMKLTEDNFDLAVFENRRPIKYLASNNIIINPFDRTSAVFLSEPLEVENSFHPLLNFIDLSDLVIPRAVKTSLPATATTFLRSGEIPLIYLEQNPLYQVLYLTFSPEESDFAQNPSFPVFFMNALTFFRKTQITRSVAGEPILLPSSEISITDPEGNQISEIHDDVFRPRTAGHYRIKNVAHLLIDPNLKESTPRKTEVPEMPILPPGKLYPFIFNWRTFALLGLIIIIFHWWYRKEKLLVRY